MTQIFHIVGRQGSGKTVLAEQIIAGLGKAGLTVRLPQDETFHSLDDIKAMVEQRNCLRDRFCAPPTPPDVLIVEHEERPEWLAATLQRNDRVITIELAS